MRPKLFFLIAAMTVLFFQSCSSQKLNRGEQIVEWINEGRIDNLRASLHDEFIFEHRDLPLEELNDSAFFLGKFMKNQKFLESEFEITKLEREEGTEDGRAIEFYQIHATYNNVYQKYLDVDPHKCLLKMEFNQGKLISMSMGRVDKESLKAFQEKYKKFETWMKKNHPDEDVGMLNRKYDQLLIQRMKEYRKQN
jgi:hypothetical protein